MTGTVDTLDVEPISPRHRWSISLRGQDRTERTCSVCQLVKITMHPPRGLPWRAWRHPSGVETQFERTPPCIVSGEVEAM